MIELEQIERCDLLLTGTKQLTKTKGDLHQRIRDVRQGPDGNLYVLTEESDGALIILEPAE